MADYKVEDYGFAYGFLAAFPEVKKKVELAAAQDWTPERLQAELKNTNWWKKRTDTQRQWDVLSKEKPSEAAAQKRATETEIGDLAKNMGVNLSSADIQKYASYKYAYGYSDAEIQNMMAQSFSYSSDKYATGAAAVSVTGLRDLASNYGIQLSDSTLQTWTRQILAGDAQVEGFEDYMRSAAKGKYTGIAEDLDRGMTVQQIFDPYKQAASQMLGISADTIDVSQDQWSKALMFRGEDGKARPMTLEEWTRNLRSDTQYGWQETEAAKNQARTLVTAIGQTFGSR